MAHESVPAFVAGVAQGGTAGQALVKASGSNFDTMWAAGGSGGTGQNVHVKITAVDSGDGNQYVFNISPVQAALCLVFVGAAFQPPESTVFQVTGASQITFQAGSGVPAGTDVYFVERSYAPYSILPTYDSYTVTNPLGETNITTTQDVYFADVYVDGAYQPPSQYTIVNTNEIAFAPALPFNTVVDFRTLQPANVPAPAQIHVSRRQTVLSSSVDTNGLPDYITAVPATLAVNLLGATTPVVMTTANGSNGNGDQNYVSVLDFDTVIPALTPSSTCYLYAELGVGGAIVSVGHLTLPPIYTYGAASTTNGQYTFRIPEMKGYLGNGVTANVVHYVFLGEAVTGVGSVTSVVVYALQGKYTSPDTAVVAANAQLYQIDHNIGVQQVNAKVYLRILIAGLGYSIGDVVEATSYAVGPSYPGPIVARLSTPNIAHFATGPGGSTGFMVPSMTPGYGVFNDIISTAADYFVIAERGW